MGARPNLDAVDRRILRALQRDGRLTTAELAEEVGLSPTPVWRRVKRLEEAGVIQGYRAVVDPTALGLTETIFVQVTVDRHSRDLQLQFAAAVAEMPEVLTAHFIAGASDFLLRVVAGDKADYYDLLVEKLYQLPGVHDVRSTFAMATLKDGAAVPV